MRQFFLPLLVSLYLLTASQAFTAQEVQTVFEEIFNESTDFIIEVLSSDNTVCKEQVIYPFLQDTRLGTISSECFRIIFEGDIRDVRQQTLPEFMEKMQYVQQEDIQKAREWLDDIALDITREEFDQMKRHLEDLKVKWGACL